LVPSGPGYTALASQVCSTTGAIAGQSYVNGDNYINSSYQYFHANKWRNVGIVIAFIIFQMLVYLVAAEYISAQKSKGEVLVFPRHQIPKELKEANKAADEESGTGKATVAEKLQNNKQNADSQDASMIQRQTAVFQWQDVVYDIKIKGEPRRILDHVDGWVKPGQMTALMGVSGGEYPLGLY
jgi:ATP-binding cassette subfamily G (WHITE) protein 2 (PDR)